jgi:hypothetical protein
MVATLEAENESASELSPRDPTYAARAEEIEGARSGMAQVVSDTFLRYLGETKKVSVTSRTRLCALLMESLPSLVPELPDEARKQVPVQLEQLVEAEQDKAVKTAVKVLRDSVISLPPRKPIFQLAGPATAPSMPAAEWSLQTCAAGGFRVMLPGVGIELATDAPHPGGAPIHMQLLGTRTVSGIKFWAARTDGRETPEVIEQRLLTNLLPGEEAVDRSQALVSGHVGTQIARGGTPPRAALRLAVINGHAYLLVVEAENLAYRIPPKDIERFFDSFQIIDDAGTTPSAAGQ